MPHSPSYISSLTELILGDAAPGLHMTMSLALIAITAILTYLVWSRVCVPVIVLVVRRSSTSWDDALLNDSVLRAFGQLLPALIVNHWLPSVFYAHNDTLYLWLNRLTQVYIVWSVWFLAQRLMRNLYNKLVEDNHINEHSSKGLLQMFIIIISCAAVVISVSICVGRSPSAIITALGASTAILMLVFKDTILGLVAGVQLSANKMLKKGDWIIVDRAGANGEIEDVSLTTVKVRNWDESITTVPPYILISDSFQNYANMRQIGARRVMRSVSIDVTSIRFLDDDTCRSLIDDGLITADEAAGKNVNLTLFRHHLERMLTANPNVRTDMRMMVRQLQPTASGIPIELFFFIKQTEWAPFEAVQADIFDTVYALVNRFGLRIYQQPSGYDLTAALHAQPQK